MAVVSCPESAPHDAFVDAIDFLLHERESVSGGVCIGGPGEIGHLAGSHLAVSAIAVVLAALIAIPIGLWLGHMRRGGFLAVSVCQVGRAVRSLARLAFVVAVLGVGPTSVIAVLTLLALPAILTNTYVGVAQVDQET